MTKKQLLPLLAIALVVAILSTGVFYGLVATKMSGLAAGQAAAVAARDPAQNTSNDSETGVPLGMRAISIHVSDSSGVVALLQRGQKVDVQVVHRAGSRSSRETTVRTIVQNLEVLAVESKSQQPEGRGAPPVVTLVATPEEADILGLADSAEQVRLLLRHPEDNEVTRRTSVGAASLFRVASSGERSSAKRREETDRRVLAQR